MTDQSIFPLNLSTLGYSVETERRKTPHLYTKCVI